LAPFLICFEMLDYKKKHFVYFIPGGSNRCGSGKTAFAKHLAAHLDKKLTVKRGSDLFHSYVGDTEKAIRQMFEEAKYTESILLIDEIDAILGRRENALQRHDISFTNEFLTSMEDFDGILIATTNGFDRVDPAGISRFRERIEFKYLTARGNLRFYDTYLAPLLEKPLSDGQINAIKSIQCLTPRDFSNIKNHFFLYEKDEFDHGRLIKALKQEVADKNNNKRVVGFRTV
jgi:transitional endoplasmic reticulum ATPase